MHKKFTQSIIGQPNQVPKEPAGEGHARSGAAAETCPPVAPPAAKVPSDQRVASKDQMGAEIDHMIELAAMFGEVDTYAGKRNHARIKDTLQLELSQNPSDPMSSQVVRMHNISEKGFAFWTKNRMARGMKIFVREFCGEEKRAWVPAVVSHTTGGLRGNLVGASFGEELPMGGEASQDD